MNNKKVLLLSLGNIPTGPTTWKNGLLKHARANGVPISEIETTSITSLFKIGHLFKADIIHTFHISPSTMVFLILGKILGKKIIFTVHGNIFAEDKSKVGLKKTFWLPFYDIVFKISDKITFPSNFLHKIIVTKKPAISKKSTIIPCGIEASVQHTGLANRQPFRILEITNFNHYDKGRGVVPLIEAIEMLKNKHANLSLTIVGGGKYLEEFKSKFNSSHIQFVGFQSDVYPYFENSDIFIHCTFLDNFPYTILEAVSRKIPTISVNVGAISEMLPETSIVPLTRRGISDAISLLIGNEQLRIDNIDSNYKFNRQFTWNKLIQRYISLYE